MCTHLSKSIAFCCTLLAMLIAAACSSSRVTQLQTLTVPVATQVAAGFTSTFTPRSTAARTTAPTMTPSRTSTETRSPTPTATITPTPLPEMEARLITKVEYDEDNIYLTFWDACWSGDGSTLYYSITAVEHPWVEDLKWTAYDIASGRETALDVAPACYRQNRHTSPSGRYTISDVAVATAHPYGSGIFDIWLSDNQDMSKQRLLQGIPGGLGDVQWNGDETVALFTLANEGGSPRYFLGIQSGEIAELDENETGLSISNGAILSPDGTTVVGYGLPDAYLQLFSLVDWRATTIPEFGVGWQWSMDSQWLYYWSGPIDGDPIQFLRAYDTVSGTNSTIFDHTLLDAYDLCPLIVTASSTGRVCDFAVAPGRDKIAFWWGTPNTYIHYLWVVLLQK